MISKQYGREDKLIIRLRFVIRGRQATAKGKADCKIAADKFRLDLG